MLYKFVLIICMVYLTWSDCANQTIFEKHLFFTNWFCHSLKWCLLFHHWLELQLVANKIISILSENKQPYKSKQRKNKQETTTHTYHPTNKQRKIVIYTSSSIEKISMYGTCWPFFFFSFFCVKKIKLECRHIEKGSTG
jgi:hypothetical protein